MAHSFPFFVVLSTWSIYVSHAQCRYVADNHYVYPLDTCSVYYKYSYPGVIGEYSYRYQCTEAGRIQQLTYNTVDCSGSAVSKAVNTTDYNCDGSNAECQLVTLWYDFTCDDSVFITEYQRTLVAYECPEDSGYRANCESGSTPFDGRITECGGSNWKFTTTQPPNLCDSSASSCSFGGSSSSEETQSELSTGAIIGIVAGVIVLCALIVFLYRCCYNSGNNKPRIQNQPQQELDTAGNKLSTTNYDRFKPAPTSNKHIAPTVVVAQPATVDQLPPDGEALPAYDDATAPSATPSVPVPTVVSASLPPGWVKLQSPDGRVYYQNNNTKKTQWTKPEPEKPLPAGWRRGYANDGRVYYLNDVTKQTQWEFPSAPANNDPPAYTPNYHDPYAAANAPPPAYAVGENEPGFDRMETPQYEGAGGFTNQ